MTISIRQARPAEVISLEGMQARLDAAVSTEMGHDILKALSYLGQLLVFERDGKIVGYVAVANLTDAAERKYIADGFLDLSKPGPNVWVLEYVGGDGDVREANRLFRNLMQQIGCETYKFFRQRDGRLHQVRIAT